MFYPFTTLENLNLYKAFALRIAPTLQKLVEGRVTEVLPTLQNIYLEGVRSSETGPIQEVIEKFVAARQLSGHPITVSLWERSSDSDSDDDRWLVNLRFQKILSHYCNVSVIYLPRKNSYGTVH